MPKIFHRFATIATRSVWFGVMIFLLAKPASAAIEFTVGAGGTHKDIQSAVNACPTEGCIINLTDTVYKLPREVWIENKSGITIRASQALQMQKLRPRLYYGGIIAEFNQKGTAANPNDPERPAGWKKWPSTCQATPGGSKNSSNPYSTSGFQNNGLFVIHKSTGITVEGIFLDGVSPQYFTNKGIWNCMYDVLFGNVGFNLFQSKGVTLRDNEMRGFFTAVYMQNRNVGGAAAAPNPDDLDVQDIIPYSQYGRVGDHLIEKNYIHNNWWAFYDEMEWDIGSTIRYNVVDSNYNTRFSQSTDSTSEANNMAGGFMYVKDVMIVPHKIYNNTINASVIVIGHGGFKSGIQHYFYNNLVTNWYRKDPKLAAMLSDWRQLMSIYKDFLYNNTFEVGDNDSMFQMQSFTSGNVADPAACALTSQNSPCWLNWDAPVRIPTAIKNQWIWNGWNVQQRGTYKATYKGTEYTVANDQAIDYFGVGGLIDRMTGLGAAPANVAAQKNFWARKIPYLSTKPKTLGYMEPDWSKPVVDSTVLDKGWVAAGNKDQDGSLPDRGAIPKSKGALISPLTLKDQSIVTIDGSTVRFQYCLDGQGTFSNVALEKVDYYNDIARGSNSEWKPPKPFPAPRTLTPTSGAPKVGGCNAFVAALPVAPVDSFARFELIVKADVGGQTIRSNVGVWIWRKTAYRLDVWFTNKNGDTVSSARVGDTVKMNVVGRRTDNGTTIPINYLAATPDHNMFLSGPPEKQVNPGDTIGRGIPTAGASYPVFFTQTGMVTVAMSGLSGSLPVPGSGLITIRPGLPERAVWQSPASYSALDHSLPLDSIAKEMPQSPTAVKLQVVDRFNNPVDMPATVVINAKKIDPAIFDFGFATTATGMFTSPTGNDTWEFTSDSTGSLTPQHVVHGILGQKYWGLATVKGKTVVDSGLMKVGKPLERLFFNPVTAIDTFVTVRMPVHLIVSEDGKTVKAGTSWGSASVKLKSSFGTSFYVSATAATPTDSVVLTGGEATVWVTSNTPVALDTLYASHLFLGEGVPAVYAPVSFRMPPLPPAPVPSTAGFVDRDCDGIADSIEVELKDPQGGSNKLTTKVKIDSINVVYGTQNLWIKSGWTILPTDSSKVRIKVPGTPGIKTDWTGTVRFAYTVARPPVPDTSYITAAAVVADRMGPRLLDTAYLTENFDHDNIADTVKLLFSEPVNFTQATGWAFTVVNASGAPVATTTLSVQKVTADAADARRYTVVFKGNTAGALLAQGYKIRIAPASTLVDLASNVAGAAECAPGVPVVEIPSPVPVHSAWIKDSDGDGRADQVSVRFVKPTSRPMRGSDVPNAFFVKWAGSADTATVAKAAFVANADSTIYSFAVGPFTKGATITSDIGGVGKVTLYAPGRNGETHNVIDSVLPIPTSAKLKYGPLKDTLIVTYSEPLTKAALPGTVWMQRKNDAGHDNMDLSDAVSDASGTTWTFLIAPDGQGYAQPGDSIRLPVSGTRLIATNNNVPPSSTALSPHVQVMGGDRAPSHAYYLDSDGNGIADVVKMVFLRPLRTSPTFTFRIGAEVVEVKETAGLTIDDNRLTATANLKAGVGAFTQIITWVNALDSLGTIVSSMDNSVIVNQKFPVLDSIDPVILTAHVAYSAYGSPGEFDTLRLKFSEPVVLGTGKVIVAGTVKSSGATAPISWDGRRDGLDRWFFAPTADSVLFFCDTSCTDSLDARSAMPGRGDSIRIASALMRGILTDVNGNRPEDIAKWTKVTAGDRPLAFNVSIYPNGLHVQTQPKDPMVKTLPSLTMWAVSRDGSGFEQIQDGKKTGLTMTKEIMGQNGLGLMIDLNTPLHAKAILYDKLGVFVDQLALHITREDLIRLGIADNSGKYKIFVFFNGLKMSNEVGSGVYVARFVTYHEELLPDQTRQMRMLGNEVYSLGYRGTSK